MPNPVIRALCLGALVLPALVGCDVVADVQSSGSDATPEADAAVGPGGSTTGASNGTRATSDAPVVIGNDGHGNRGVRVAGENGVLVGDQAEVDGVRVGGEYGVMAGDDGNTQGVRVGGDKGVVVGQDADTQGVRIGGDKGVEVDVKKGVKIGGKKLFGK